LIFAAGGKDKTARSQSISAESAAVRLEALRSSGFGASLTPRIGPLCGGENTLEASQLRDHHRAPDLLGAARAGAPTSRPALPSRLPRFWTSRSRGCQQRQGAERSVSQGCSSALVKLPNKAKLQPVPSSHDATYLVVAMEPAGSTLDARSVRMALDSEEHYRGRAWQVHRFSGTPSRTWGSSD
jgi:hypothetical protein